MVRKKQFYFKTTEKPTKYGRSVEAQIFRSSKNKLKFLTSTKWQTGSYRGEESEVFNELARAKIIPKKTLKLSQNKWRGAGYYIPEHREKFGIYIEKI